jgi:uncharacterized protein (TIGR01244 family)
MVCVLVVVAAGACGRSGSEGASADAGAEAARRTPEAIAALGVTRVAEPQPGLITAAQPTREQVDGLRTMGYRTFISLRQPSEEGAGWEEVGLVSEGVEFSRIPISGATDLTRENVEALDRLLDAAGDDPVVLYCASSNRVGALLALRAYWLDGADADAALALGRAAGLAGLEPAVADLLAGTR